LYETPTGERYPSVTTVIGALADKSGLDVWKARVGEAEAEKIKVRSGKRGTAMHNICERLVLNQDLNLRREMPIPVSMFRQVERVLKANMDNVRSSEGRLFSHKLKIAGSVDLVADWKGKKAIIDFKTARSARKEEWIESYWLQTTLYSMMLYEQTGIMHPNLTIIIALEDDNEAQVFEGHVKDWIKPAIKLCSDYHTIYG
jgi:hypothetical protein